MQMVPLLRAMHHQYPTAIEEEIELQDLDFSSSSKCGHLVVAYSTVGLADRFGVRRVDSYRVLGARGRPSAHSDVDLAVEGLAGSGYLGSMAGNR